MDDGDGPCAGGEAGDPGGRRTGRDRYGARTGIPPAIRIARGVACQAEPSGVKLPTYHAYTIPNFAHYRLYDLPGSPCDTLGIDTPVAVAVTTPPKREMPMTLAPNPAHNTLTVGFGTDEPGVVTVTDLTGRMLLNVSKASGQQQVQINTGGLPNGIYLVSCRAASGHAGNQKVAVQH